MVQFRVLIKFVNFLGRFKNNELFQNDSAPWIKLWTIMWVLLFSNKEPQVFGYTLLDVAFIHFQCLSLLNVVFCTIIPNGFRRFSSPELRIYRTFDDTVI
jgi:hypothetical protein